MDTLFDYVASDVRWKEALEEAEKLSKFVSPENKEKYEMLNACLTAHSLARAFYSEGHYRRQDEDDAHWLVRLGAYAACYRNVFLAIAEMRCGNRGPRARAQALREIEACHRWLKQKGLRGWCVLRCDEKTKEWVEVKPSEFTSRMIDAYDKGLKAAKDIEAEAAKKEAKSKPRGDKYDNDNEYNYTKE